MLIPYMLIWAQVQVWGFFGFLFDKSYNLEQMILSDWNAKVSVLTSRAIEQEAWYELLGLFGVEWIVCDPIMFKFWLIHGINQWIPELKVFEAQNAGLTLNYW